MRGERQGFSLIEALIGLGLTLGILASSLGFLNVGRKVFFKLKAAEEERLAVLAALERVRIDAGRAGLGLAEPVRWGILSGLAASEAVLTIESLERRLTLASDIPAGASRIECSGTEDLAANRVICIFDDAKGEVGVLADSGRGFIALTAPVRNAYEMEGSQVAVVASVKYFLQGETLRRQANNSPAQPLLDDVAAWEVARGAAGLSVTSVRIRLNGKERIYGSSILSKNISLSAAGR